MKPWLRWMARFGMAAACVMAVGCGSDVPDTSTEGQAAAGGARASEGAGPAAEPKTEVASAPTAPSEPKGEEAAPAEASAPPAAPEAPAKKEGGSATAEMYALATTPSTGSNPSAGGGPAPSTPSSGAPAGPGAPGPGGPAGGMSSEMMARMGNQGRPGMGPGAPGINGPAGGAPGAGGPAGMNPGMMGMRPGMMPGGMPPGPNPGEMSKMMANQMGAGNRPGMPGAPGGAAGNASGPGGGAGGANAANGPANLHTPEGAVTAFLNALKAKDLDSLNEAMAGHAPIEAAAAKTREIFQKIFDLNLSDSDLDDLAKKLEGYQIVTVNPPKSTGRLDVVIQKRAENGAIIGRRVTVRREKKGWGVVDISGPSEFKAMNNFGQRRR